MYLVFFAMAAVYGWTTALRLRAACRLFRARRSAPSSPFSASTLPRHPFELVFAIITALGSAALTVAFCITAFRFLWGT